MSTYDELARARNLLDVRRPREALALATAVLASEPDDLTALLVVGDCHAALGNSTDHLEVALRAVTVAPNSVRAQLALTDAFYVLERYEESRNAAQAAVKLSPHDWTTHYMLSRSLSAGPDALPARALLSAREATRLAPHSSDAHVAKAMALTGLNMIAEARESYGEALRLDPTNQYALGNMSILMAGRGRFATASQHVAAGLAVDPQAEHLQQTYLDLVVRLCFFFFCGVHALATCVIGIGVATGMTGLARCVIALGCLTACTASLVRVSRRLPGGLGNQVDVLRERTNLPQRFLLALWLLSTAVLVMAGLLPTPTLVVIGRAVADFAVAVPWSAVMICIVIARVIRRTTRHG